MGEGKLVIACGILPLALVSEDRSYARIRTTHISIELDGFRISRNRFGPLTVPLKLLRLRILLGSLERSGRERLGLRRPRVGSRVAQYAAEFLSQFVYGPR